MTRVELSLRAIERLDQMVVTHSLPGNTHKRVQRSLRRLERFPKIGREAQGRWKGLRFISGPWRWLLIVYVHDAEQDIVSVITVQDARSSTAVTSLVPPR